MYASKFGELDTAALLIKKGADINAKDNLGFTAIKFALLFGKQDMVKLIIEKGKLYLLQ
jgi:ankyrin repeat protein